MNTSKGFYNSFYQLYPFVDYFLKGQKQILAKHVNQLRGGNLLEVGIGNGSVLPLYRKHSITGIDTAANMLRVAAKRKLNTAANLLEMNGEALQFDDFSFDYVVISHVISVTENPEIMLQESHRVLKPGGILLLHNHFTPSNILRYADKFTSLFSPLLRFKAALKIADLKALSLFRQQRQINLGPGNYFKILILKK